MSDDAKCRCGHPEQDHHPSLWHCHCGCREFWPAEEAKPEPQGHHDPTCPTCMDGERCDRHEKAAPESVYERARKELDAEECDCGMCECWARHEITLVALDAGEKAEQRAEAAENRIAETELSCGMPLGDILTTLHAHRQTAEEDHARAEAAERILKASASAIGAASGIMEVMAERDALKARVAELEATGRRWYLPDGSYQEFDPEEVIRRRIDAAKRIAEMEALLARCSPDMEPPK